jgi:hypothetical protein
VKKIAEFHAGNPDGAAHLIRELEKGEARKRIEGLKLGGLITSAVGLGLLVFLRTMVPNSPGNLIGLIPVLVGAAFLVYCFFLAPKE